MNREPSLVRRIVTGAALTGIGAFTFNALSNNDTDSQRSIAPAATATPFEDLTSATDAPTSTIATEEVQPNPFYPTAEELAGFECTDPENEQYGITIGEFEGTQFVEPILSGQIPIDFDAHNAYRREVGKSLDAPATVDVNDNDAFHAELSARLCGRPAVLGETVHYLVNSRLYLEVVGEADSTLARYRDMTPDEVSKEITNPHNGENLTADQVAENMAVTRSRETLSEYVIFVLSSAKKVGNRTDLPLHSPYALDPIANFNPEEPVKYLPSDYTGGAFLYDLSPLSDEKGQDEGFCPEDDIFGYNTGAITNGLEDDGDLRLVIPEGDDCVETPDTTIPGYDTTTTVETPTTLKNKTPQTPTGGTAVDTTIEAPKPGPSNPTTSQASTTTAVTSTSSTVYVGPPSSQPQTPVTSTTVKFGY